MTRGQLYQDALALQGVGHVDRYSILQLMMACEGVSSIDELLTHLDLPVVHLHVFKEKLARLQQGEPVAYILEKTTFYHLPLRVNQDVLIPRPETEELVDWILKTFASRTDLRLIDIGTGSGAIALAIKHHQPLWQVTATDISEAALKVAQDNAKTLELDIQWYLGDGLSPLLSQDSPPTFDVIVSNPPYVASESLLDDSVKTYEPHLALLASPPIYFYQHYLTQAKTLISPKGVFVFEITPEVVASFVEVAKKIYPESSIEIKQDINGKSRLAILYT